MSRLDLCRLVDLPKFADHRGNLSFIESGQHIPFEIRRLYYLYDVPGGEPRGVHAHKNLEQLIFPAHGQFEIMLDDGSARRTFLLDRPDQGIYIPSLIWRELDHFSPGAVCMVLASQFYDPDDYIHEYDEFIEYLKKQP